MSADILTTSPVCLAIREGPTISEQTIPNLLGLVEIRRFVKYLEIITTPTPIPPNGIMIPPWTTPEDVYEFIKRSDKWGNYVQQTVGISEASLGSFRQAATQEQRAASTRRSRLIPADQADIRRIRERVAELDGRLTLAVERFEEAFERTRSMALQIASIMYQRNLGWHHNPAELPKPSLSQRTVYAATAIGMGATAIAPLITPPAEIRTVEEVGLEEQQTTEKVQTAQELFEQIRKNGFNLADLNAQMEAWLRENQPQGQEAQQQEENLPFAPEFVSLGPVESITAESIKANPQEFWQTLVENPNYIAMIRPHLMKVTELVDSWGANRDDILIGVVLAESPNGVIATAVTFRVDEENRIFFSAPGLPNLNYAEQPIEIVLYNKGPFTNFAVASDGGLLGPVDEVNGGFTIVQPEEGAEITKEGIIGVVILDADGRIWQDTGSEAPPPTPEPLRAMDEIILAGYEQEGNQVYDSRHSYYDFDQADIARVLEDARRMSYRGHAIPLNRIDTYYNKDQGYYSSRLWGVLVEKPYPETVELTTLTGEVYSDRVYIAPFILEDSLGVYKIVRVVLGSEVGYACYSQGVYTDLAGRFRIANLDNNQIIPRLGTSLPDSLRVGYQHMVEVSYFANFNTLSKVATATLSSITAVDTAEFTRLTRNINILNTFGDKTYLLIHDGLVSREESLLIIGIGTIIGINTELPC